MCFMGEARRARRRNARAVVGRTARDAVSIDAVNATTTDDDSEATAGHTLRPRRWRRMRPATSSMPPPANGCSPATISCSTTHKDQNVVGFLGREAGEHLRRQIAQRAALGVGIVRLASQAESPAASATRSR